MIAPKNQILTRLIYSSIIFLVFVFFSCSGNKSDKIKDLDSIRSKSSYRPPSDSITPENKIDTLLTYYNQDSVELDIKAIELDSNNYILNQFAFKKALQLNLSDSKKHLYHHRFWQMNVDSNLVKNNFYNWFDREFCQRNLDIKIYTRFNLTSSNLLFFCTNQSIHVIESADRINPMKWIQYIMRTEKNVAFSYICYQTKNRAALWYAYQKNKLILIPAL
jgi:hypothetical protein